MRYLFTALALAMACSATAQIRAFDNSKATLPWLYNPAADLSDKLQFYAGYDGRSSGNNLPQSMVAGARMPLQTTQRRGPHAPASMMGMQLLKTSQDMIKSTLVSANFAHRIPLSRASTLAFGMGAGVLGMRYNHSGLVYLDQPDPLLGNGEDFFNFHLNAGAEITFQESIRFSVALPAILQDKGANFDEVIIRASYAVPVNPDATVIVAANLDTYNRNAIYGGDVQFAWRNTVSLLAGADRYKFHGGVRLGIKSMSVFYTYGMNYSHELEHVPVHQLGVFSRVNLR